MPGTEGHRVIRVLDITGVRKFLPEHREGVATRGYRYIVAVIAQGPDHRDVARCVAEAPVQW